MADEPPSRDLEQSHFGKYLLDQELGRGGMARVFRARLRGPGGFEKKLVVKQILPELARDPSFIALFVKEANTLVQMSHPNLVPVYELGVIDGVYFLAMESIEGATVAELLEDGPLGPPLVALIGAQIADALRYAHERFQIVHRDVTPRNIIVDEAGHVRLLDFGIAAPIGHEGRGELFGSPGYIAPEQLRGDPLGPESDVFSLGAVLYEALRGEPAFPEARRNPGERASYTPAPPLTAATPLIAGVCARMLSLERAERPASAAEVSNTLRTWLAENHPQGVDRELAERARRAIAARARRPAPSAQSAAAVSSGRIEVRSLAVSPALEEMLQQHTVKIERESDHDDDDALETAEEKAPEPVPDTLDDPEAHVVLRRFLRDIFVVSVALVVALWLAENRPLREEEAPEPPERSAVGTPAADSPPSAARSGVVPVAPLDPGASAGAPAAAVDGAPPAAETPKSGFVTVSAAPWAHVTLDGRDAGVTPRRRVPVKPGKHVLVLTCPPLGREARVPLEVQSEQALQVVVDLNETPARVSVR